MNEEGNPSVKVKKKISLMKIIDSLTSKQLDSSSMKSSNGVIPNNEHVSSGTSDNESEKYGELHTKLTPTTLIGTNAAATHFLEIKDAAYLKEHSSELYDDEQADPPLLEMQSPGLRNQKSAIVQLIESLANGTDRVKNILKHEVDLIYECKRCRGLFRGLPNLIRHKKDYCRDFGHWSSFINRSNNSTYIEDLSFQEILNTLQPPLESDFSVKVDPLSKSSSAVSQVVLSEKLNGPLDSAAVGKDTGRSHSVTSQTRTSSSEMKIPLSFSVDTAPESLIGHMKGKDPSPYNFPSASTKTGKPKPKCPLCHKQMAERKNVRRHLVRVHMLSVIDSLKLMHRNRKVFHDSAHNRNYAESCSSLRDKSISSMIIGNNRKIYVLPSSTVFTNTQCPVCKKVLCSKTNLKRHLLEAHDLVVHGGRKYIQLKLLANKSLASSSPTSLRRLHLNDTCKNICDRAEVNNHKSLDLNHQIGSPNQGTQIENPDNNLKNENLPRATSTQDDSHTSTKNDSCNKTGGDIEMNMKSCQCLLCNKVFSRQSNLKRHMMAFHAWDKQRFHSVDVEINVREAEPAKSVTQKINTNINISKARDEIKTDGAKGKYQAVGKTFEPPEKKIKMVEVKIRRDPQLKLTLKRKAHESKCSSAPDSSVNMMKEIHGKGTTSETSVKSVENISKSEGRSTITRFNNLNGTKESGERKELSLQKISDRESLSPHLLKNSSSTRKSFIKVTLEKPIIAARKSRTDIGLSNGKYDFTSNSNIEAASSGNVPEFNVKKMGQTQPNYALAKYSDCFKTIPKSDSFDIGKCICYNCNKTFESPISTKRHLVEVHSFSIADALASSYDCSKVNEEVLEAGRELGFDIRLATCLICNQYYFSRENLSKHMSKIHHLRPKDLEILKHMVLKEDSSHSQTVSIISSNGDDDSRKKFESNIAKQEDCKAMINKISSIQQSNKTAAKIRQPVELFVKKDGIRCISEDGIRMALDIFPKDWINARTMRCIKCKHKYKNALALKVHLLKHIGGLGLYACKLCTDSNIYVTNLSVDLLKHHQSSHKKVIKSKQRMMYLRESRINNKELWIQYGLPVGKW